MSYGRNSGGGLKGLMMLAMLFVFGGAAYLAARDFEGELCGEFRNNSNVIRRVGEVRECGVAIQRSLAARQLVVHVRGGAGQASIAIERRDRTILRAYLTTPDRPEPELVYGADPMVPTSRIMTR